MYIQPLYMKIYFQGPFIIFLLFRAIHEDRVKIKAKIDETFELYK